MDQTPEPSPMPERQLTISLDGVSIVNTATGEDQTPAEAVADLHSLEEQIAAAEQHADALLEELREAKERAKELKAKREGVLEVAKKATRALRDRVRAMKALPIAASRTP